jgi:hypothetical protein
MKEITLLLVLANLAFLGWDRWVAPTSGPAAAIPASPLPANLQRLTLATEVVAPSSGPAAASAGPTDGSDGSPTDTPQIGNGEAGAPLAPTESAPADAIAPESTTSLITQDVPADVRTTLPDERNSAEGESAPSERVALLAATPVPHCVSLGPYLDLAETAEAAARLRERGHMPSQRLADSPLWVGNWVYLAPFNTRAEATAAVEKLRVNGVDDLYIEPSGEDENAVSLGLYSDRERAEALAAEIRKLGYTPQISDKYRVASVYWVDVVLPPDVSLDPAKYQVRSGRVVRAQEHQCPEGTAMPGVVADTNSDDE